MSDSPRPEHSPEQPSGAAYSRNPLGPAFERIPLAARVALLAGVAAGMLAGLVASYWRESLTAPLIGGGVAIGFAGAILLAVRANRVP
jgi:hypothetical protein